MLHRSQSKRLDKLEAKTRAQYEKMITQYWDELLSVFSWQERHAATAALHKWFTSPPEHKTDEAAWQEHFTPEELGYLQRGDKVWSSHRAVMMRECLASLWLALQACERVRA